jgi:predicted membrane-bound dolichyl-phosphate-mannose-protein mannosyltransferase
MCVSLGFFLLWVRVITPRKTGNRFASKQKGKPMDNSNKTTSSGTVPKPSQRRQKFEFNLQDFWAFLRPKLFSINIGHLLLVLLALHLFAMSFPNNSGAYVFDESYYVGSSHFDQDLLNLVASNLEHPFFGKIWGALGIYLFGDNFFGWRIFYVLLGTLTVWVFYELALVFFSKGKALFAASLLGFETLFFIHTSTALLEGPPILFGLLGFLLYFKKKYYLSALAFGLSILSKEWGLYFLVAFFLYLIFVEALAPAISRRAGRGLKAGISTSAKIGASKNPIQISKVLLFLVILILTVLIPLWAYDLVYHPVVNGVAFNDPTQNFRYYYNYHTSLTISPSDASDPWHYAWNWINPFTVSPDDYYVVTVNFYNVLSNGTKILTGSTYPIDWLGIGNLVIWYSIWAIVPFLVLKPIITKSLTRLEAFVGAWIIGTYVPSLYLSGLVHRVVYAFYFINVDPALALGIPMLISFISPESSGTQKALMGLWLGAAIVFFILFFPVHPGPGL